MSTLIPQVERAAILLEKMEKVNSSQHTIFNELLEATKELPSFQHFSMSDSYGDWHYAVSESGLDWWLEGGTTVLNQGQCAAEDYLARYCEFLAGNLHEAGERYGELFLLLHSFLDKKASFADLKATINIP